MQPLVPFVPLAPWLMLPVLAAAAQIETIPVTKLVEWGIGGIMILFVIAFARWAGPIVKEFVTDVKVAFLKFLKDSSDRYDKLTAIVERVYPESVRAQTEQAAASRGIEASLKELVNISRVQQNTLDDHTDAFTDLRKQLREIDKKLEPRKREGGNG